MDFSARQLAKPVARVVPPIRLLLAERNSLREEASTLKRERDHLLEEASALKRERDHLLQEVDALKSKLDEAISRDEPPSSATSSILNAYINEPPTTETPFRIFKGEWSSDVPSFGLGLSKLFNDDRLKWIEHRCGGFAGKRILELGPLEGGHTFMMASRGAAHITSIESNIRAYLKCLIVKDTLNFDAKFLLGDFRLFLSKCRNVYDFVLASGVLYHMTDPISLLADIARVTTSMGIWTHYYDRKVILDRDDLREKFAEDPARWHVGGRDITMYRQSYLKALELAGFCGGSVPISYWLTKDSLLGYLEDLGLKVEIGGDELDHPNGPCILLYASR